LLGLWRNNMESRAGMANSAVNAITITSREALTKKKWADEEENDLIHLHAEHGNRWALISKLIPGRS